MIKAILKGILKMILSVLNIVLLPINSLLENLFPSLNSYIELFDSLISRVSNVITWFFSIFPPMFRQLLAVWFTFIVSYYTIYYTYKGILKIWTIIQKIKFW